MALTNTIARLDRSTWDSRVLPDKTDVRVMLDRCASLEEALRAVRKDIDDLVRNSAGVAGLHMNGEIAEWDSLLPGGSFGAWLGSVEQVDDVLAQTAPTKELADRHGEGV